MIELIVLIMQHFLRGVILNMLFGFIVSETYHIRHFINVQFVIKGIEIINLPSILKIHLLSRLFLLHLKILNQISFIKSTINLFVLLY